MEHQFASDEECYFSWYLSELFEAGFVRGSKYQPKPFPLAEKQEYSFIKQLKTKTKQINKTLLREHQYQADFMLFWTPKAEYKFFTPNDLLSLPFVAQTSQRGFRTILDVKGTFNQNDAWRRFSIEQKWVWQKYGLYVQKIIPDKLFKATFTPSKYLLTDKSGKPRKIAWETRTLAEYIASL